MARGPALFCTVGGMAGSRIEVPEGGLKLGRAEENHVILKDDDGVSRFHARLLFDNGSLWIQDAGSRNGVFVNDVRVTGHQALRVGDKIRIGGHEFEVRWSDPVEEDSDIRPRPVEEPRRKSRWWPFGG